eukprot:scaffold302_cov247-Pinguiococcus_pyrenoidosus.AAC.35
MVSWKDTLRPRVSQTAAPSCLCWRTPCCSVLKALSNQNAGCEASLYPPFHPREGLLDLPRNRAFSFLLEVLIRRREAPRAQEGHAVPCRLRSREWRRVRRLDRVVLRSVYQLDLGVRRLAPEQEDHVLAVVADALDDGICERFPSGVLVTARLGAPHCEHRVQQQDALGSPLLQVAMVRRSTADVRLNLPVDVAKRPRDRNALLDAERETMSLAGAPDSGRFSTVADTPSRSRIPTGESPEAHRSRALPLQPARRPSRTRPRTPRTGTPQKRPPQQLPHPSCCWIPLSPLPPQRPLPSRQPRWRWRPLLAAWPSSKDSASSKGRWAGSWS